jgi:hypothetical protein
MPDRILPKRARRDSNIILQRRRSGRRCFHSITGSWGSMGIKACACG